MRRLAFGVVIVLASFAWAGIELKEVPTYIRLPLPPNENLLITAVVDVKDPSAVWAAPTRESKNQVELTSQAGNTYQLNLGDQRLLVVLRADNSQQFQVFARTASGEILSSAVVRCSVAPAARLTLPAGGARLTVYQRRTKDLPGSDGSIRVHIDDVTGGQVLVSVSTADGEELLDEASLKQGGDAAFAVNGTEYVVIVEKLVNRLTSEDWAELLVTTRAESEKIRIEAAIKRIESSGLTFIRNGDEHTAADAGKHIRQKLDRAGDRIKTFDEFVEGIASKSSLSGDPYLVKLPDGSTMELEKWLRQ